MADLPEVATYDAGVYQLEVTDAVVGGVDGKSNAAARALANRTKYLKEHVDALEGSTMLSKSVAGGVDVTLTADEAKNRILEFHGILTANISVIVPASPTRDWIVINETNGAYTLTIKTPAGTGVLVAQTASAHIYTDGINVHYDAPVVPQDEAEAGIETTLRGWNALRVRQASLAALSGMLSKSVAGAADVALTATESSKGILKFTGAITANLAVTVPINLVRTWVVENATTGAFTLTIKPVGGTGVTVAQGYDLPVWSDGTNIYGSFTEPSTATKPGIAPLATLAEVQAGTDTSKIVTPSTLRAGLNRETLIVSSATPTPDCSTTDIFGVTALGVAATFGAPTNATQGGCLLIRIKDDGTARALTWNAIYRAIGITLPTTTVLGKTIYLGMFYNFTDTKWDVVGVNEE